MDVQQMQNN